MLNHHREMATNLTFNISEKYRLDAGDFWSDLYEWHLASILSTITAFISLFIGLPFLMNGYEYIENKHYKTILDSFDLSLVWILLFGTIFHIIALSRNLFGPLPEFLCWIQAFTRNSTGVAACLMFDILIIFRYLYIFVIKNFTLVKEDLLYKFFNWSVFLIASMAGFLHMLSPGKQGVNYYMCLGIDPFLDPYDFRKFPWASLMYPISFLVYPIIFFKISSHKIKQNQKVSPTTPNLERNFNTCLKPKYVEHSMLDVVTVIGTMSVILFDGMTWGTVSKLDVDVLMKPNTFACWIVFWHNNFIGDALIWIFVSLLYLKNPKLRESTKKKFVTFINSFRKINPFPNSIKTI